MERSEKQAINQDLKIYYSAQNEKPCPSQFDKKFIDKQEIIMINAHNEDGERLKIFEQNYVNLGFYSKSGCRIQISFTFYSGSNQNKSLISSDS